MIYVYMLYIHVYVIYIYTLFFIYIFSIYILYIKQLVIHLAVNLRDPRPVLGGFWGCAAQILCLQDGYSQLAETGNTAGSI